VVRDKIATFQLPKEKCEEVYDKIKTGTNEDAIVALLILSFPNLRRLVTTSASAMLTTISVLHFSYSPTI
jgi:hypothetical protein